MRKRSRHSNSLSLHQGKKSDFISQGTIIRVFSSEGGELLQELRRGSEKAIITTITFHPSMNLIVCTSNRSSIHLFEIKKSIERCIENKEYGFSNGDV